MKKYLFTLLLMIVTFAVFSRPVDRPPDDNSVSIEITQQNDFICPVVIDQPILTVKETIYQTEKEMPAILTSIENKGDVQKGKATTIHLKKSGTERYLNVFLCGNIENPTIRDKKVIPSIRGSDNLKNKELIVTT